MSFGFSIGDFIAATQIATTLWDSLKAVPDRNSVIILSFRSLQAQRIKELQKELYQASVDRIEALRLAAPESNEADSVLGPINSQVDCLLNSYG